MVLVGFAVEEIGFLFNARMLCSSRISQLISLDDCLAEVQRSLTPPILATFRSMEVDEYANLVLCGPRDRSFDIGPLLIVLVHVFPERRVFALAVLFAYSPVTNLT
jgi:hypothetical protein